MDGEAYDYKIVWNGRNCRSNSKLPPVRSFWSITCYDALGFTVRNSQDIYSLGSITYPPLEENDDGNVVIYLSSQEPEQNTIEFTNWLPIPKDVFSLTARFYNPEESILDEDYLPPIIQKWRKTSSKKDEIVIDIPKEEEKTINELYEYIEENLLGLINLQSNIKDIKNILETVFILFNNST